MSRQEEGHSLLKARCHTEEVVQTERCHRQNQLRATRTIQATCAQEYRRKLVNVPSRQPQYIIMKNTQTLLLCNNKYYRHQQIWLVTCASEHVFVGRKR